MTRRAAPLELVRLVGAVRSPLDRPHGALAHRHPAELLAEVLQALEQRIGAGAGPIRVGDIDALIVGCAEPVGGQSGNIARAAALAAGWPETRVAWTLDAGATAGHLALHQAVALVQSGQARAVVAAAVDIGSLVPAGAAAMGRHPYGRPWGDAATARAGETGLLPPGVAAEHIAERYGVTAEALEAWGARTRARSQAAQNAGAFRDEIVAVTVAAGDDPVPDPPRRRGQAATRRSGPHLLEIDGVFARPAVTHANPPSLTRPASDSGPSGLITAATLAPIADGAAAVLVTAADRGRAGGTDDDRSRAPGAGDDGRGGEIVIEAVASAGGALGDRTISVAEVVRRVLEGGLRPTWYELDETWSVDVLAIAAQLGLDLARHIDLDRGRDFAIDHGRDDGSRSALVNPWGGALTLGQAGAVGALRSIVSAAHALRRGSPGARVVVAGGDAHTAAATVLARPRP
jgi:acetyl-CoA acetyltransferase